MQSFTTTQILERHVNNCFGINDKQLIKMGKNGENVKFKNYTKKINSPFIMIDADFESILVRFMYVYVYFTMLVAVTVTN